MIPNGVDCEIYQSASRADLTQFGIPPNSQTAIFVGRLDPQKDPLLLLDAMKRVAADHPDFHLLIVGDGPLHDELSRKLNALQLTDRVHLIGRRQDVPSLLKSCQFLVLPSQWEGMPNVVLEAMASGLPVIATSIEGTTELIRHSENGLLISPGSVEEIIAMMSRLLRNPAEAQTLGTAAQATVAAEFTWDTMVDRYCALYRSILDD